MNTTTSRSRIALGATAAILVVAGSMGAPAATGFSQKAPASAVPADAAALADGQTVDTQMVIGHDGTPVGFLAEANPIGDEPLELGASGTDFRGLVVRSERGGGDVVGYLLTGDPGFVSVDEVNDPEALARIEAAWAADREISSAPLPPESRRAIDDYESQLQTGS